MKVQQKYNQILYFELNYDIMYAEQFNKVVKEDVKYESL